MKTLTLKETRSPYTLTLNETTLDEGPVRVLRGEQIVGVLVSPEEYEKFRVWREAQERPQQWGGRLWFYGRNIIHEHWPKERVRNGRSRHHGGTQ